MDAETVELATRAFVEALDVGMPPAKDVDPDPRAFPINVSHQITWDRAKPLSTDVVRALSAQGGASAAREAVTLGAARWPGARLVALTKVTLTQGEKPVLEWAVEVRPTVARPAPAEIGSQT